MSFANEKRDGIDTPVAAEKLPWTPALILLALITAWVGSTVIWGFNGFVAGADIAVVLAFTAILVATRTPTA